MQAGWVRGPSDAGVPQDQPRGFLALHRIEIKHELRESESLLKPWRECRFRQTIRETQKAKKSESQLCLGSGVCVEDCGLVHTSSQTSRNKDECLDVTYALSQGLSESVVLENVPDDPARSLLRY